MKLLKVYNSFEPLLDVFHASIQDFEAIVDFPKFHKDQREAMKDFL